MPKRLKPYSNFNKGMNDSVSTDSLFPEELKEAYNVDLMLRGGYDQRWGCSPALNAPLSVYPISRMIDYPGKPLVVNNKILMDWEGNVIKSGLNSNEIGWEFFTNKNLYFVDGVNYYFFGKDMMGKAQAGGNTTITLQSGSSATNDFFNNMTITILDGTGVGQSKAITDYDGTTKIATISNTWSINPDATSIYKISSTTPFVHEVLPADGADLTAIKRCTMLLQRGQRMFATGDPISPNTLYYSELGEPNNFLLTSSVNAITDDTDTINSMALFSSAVVALKKRHLYAWTGWDPTTDVEFPEIDVHSGTSAPLSVCKAADYLVYLGDDAVIALVGLDTGKISSMRVSPGITDTLKELTNRDKAVGVYYKGSYYLACCNDGTGINNLVLKGHVSMEYPAYEKEAGYEKIFPWTIYTGWNVGQWFIDENEDLYFGSSSDGMIYRAFDGINDDTTPVYMKVTHRVNLGDSYRIKKLKQLFLLLKQYDSTKTNLNVYLTMGYQRKALQVIEVSEGMIWDESNWNELLWGWVDMVKKEIKLGKKIDRLEITIEHNALNERATVYGFAANYKPKKPKGVKIGVNNI